MFKENIYLVSIFLDLIEPQSQACVMAIVKNLIYCTNKILIFTTVDVKFLNGLARNVTFYF